MTRSTRFSAAIRNNLAGLALLGLAWFLLAQCFPAYILPGPGPVLAGLPERLAAVWNPHLLLTLKRVAVGFALAYVAGGLLGILAFTARLTGPLTSLMVGVQAIPGAILGIILLLILGIGDGAPIALVAVLTLPTIAINTSSALARRDVALEQYLTTARANRGDVIRFLYIPTLIPTLQSNLSLGFGLALKVVVLGEYIGSQAGLGYLLNVATIHFDMQAVLAYLTVILILGALVEVVQNLVFARCLARYFHTA